MILNEINVRQYIVIFVLLYCYINLVMILNEINVVQYYLFVLKSKAQEILLQVFQLS